MVFEEPLMGPQECYFPTRRSLFDSAAHALPIVVHRAP